MATIPYADTECVLANFDRDGAPHMLITKPSELRLSAGDK